jgi:hypothetical protein
VIMAVEPELTRSIMREEMHRVHDYGKAHKWGIIPNYPEFSVIVTMYAHNGDLFVIKLSCDNYRELPPIIDFIDPETGEIGTMKAYPKGSDSFFNTTGPCICAPFSRKAYDSLHQQWSLGNWTTSAEQNVNWAQVSNLVGILSVIQSRLLIDYKGRMA